MLSPRHAVAIAPATALAVALLAAPVSAGSDTHFVGTFNPGITGTGCQTGVNSPAGADVVGVPLVDPATFGPASGTWRVNVGMKTASARFVIYLKGQPHVAFTLPMSVVSRSGGVVVATGVTGAGPLTVTISNGIMSYRINGYDSTSFMNPAAYCPQGSVTYTGTVTS